MPFEKGTPLASLKQWETIAGVEVSLVEKIKYFYGFQTYLAEENVRKPSAIFITSDDQVYAIGYNASDNLLALEGEDLAKTVNLTEPRKIKGLSGMKIKKITVRERFGCALTEDGKLLYWGMEMDKLQYEERSKDYLQLPHIPRKDLEIEEISCGGHSITFLTKNGDVLIWGCLTLQYSSFYEFAKIDIPNDAAIISVTSGWYHVAVLDDQGRVWTFGIGSVGELGYQWSPIASLSRLDYITPKPVQLTTKCVKVECGSNSTLFLLESGDVYACGNNLQLDHLCVGKKGHVFEPRRVFLNEPIGDIMAAYNWSGKQWQSRFTAMSLKGEYFKWGEDKSEKVPSKATDAHSLAEMYVNFITPQAYGSVNRIERDVNQVSKPSDRPPEVAKKPGTKLPIPSAEEPQNSPKAPTDKPKVSTEDRTPGVPSKSQEAVKPVGLPSDKTPGAIPRPAKPKVPSPEKPKLPSPDKPKNTSLPKPAIQNAPISSSPSQTKPNKINSETKPKSPQPNKASPGPTTSSSGSIANTKRPSNSQSSTSAQHPSSSQPKGSLKIDLKGKPTTSINQKLAPPESMLSNWSLFKAVQKPLAQKIVKFLVFSGYDTGKRQESLGAFVLTKDDEVLGFGINTEEKLLGLAGNAAQEYFVAKPTKIQSLSGRNIKKIVVNLFQGASLSKDGSVFLWNQESEPMLMDLGGKKPIDVACGSKFVLILTSDSNIYLTGELSYEFEEVKNKKLEIPNGVKIKSVECGEWHGAFLSIDGDAYTFGQGAYDQLGYIQEPEDDAYEAKKVVFDQPCTKIACGVRSTVFLLKNGDVYACGSKEATDLPTADEHSSGIPEKMDIPEPAVDLVAVIRSANYGARVDKFVVKSKTGKIYKWSGRNTAVIDNATTLLEAFKGHAIPQSMSMVDYEFQEGDFENLQSSPTVNESNASTNEGEKTGMEEESGGRILLEEKIVGPAETKGKDTPVDKPSYGRPDQDLPIDSPPKDDKTPHGSKQVSEYAGDKNFGDDKKPKQPSNNLLGDPRYSDLSIKLSNDTVPAHKVLLYTKSSFFRRAISRHDIEELDLSAYNPKSVMALLKHIYGVPIGEQVSIEDAVDFQEMAAKDGGSSILLVAKLLLYSSTLYDVITTHLDSKPKDFKAKILKAILPSKVFP